MYIRQLQQSFCYIVDCSDYINKTYLAVAGPVCGGWRSKNWKPHIFLVILKNWKIISKSRCENSVGEKTWISCYY